jgi:Transposase
MASTKYIGMDVHKESISIAVMNASGQIGMECVIETKASMILQFFDGLRGDLQVTFEEGTSAAWLYGLLKPQVTKLVVCDPRENASMREGNQSDKIDVRRLAELLRLNHHKTGDASWSTELAIVFARRSWLEISLWKTGKGRKK